jgi:hypothetical protein
LILVIVLDCFAKALTATIEDALSELEPRFAAILPPREAAMAGQVSRLFGTGQRCARSVLRPS